MLQPAGPLAEASILGAVGCVDAISPAPRAELGRSARYDAPMIRITARLRLQPFSEDPLDALLDFFRDASVRRFLLDDALVDRAWVTAEIKESRERFAAGSLGLYAAYPRDASDSLVGFVGFRPFYDPPVLQLVYGVAPQYVGRGFASELAKAAVDLAFSEHGFTEVRASTDEPNHASVRVLKRLGMRLVSTSPGERWPQLHFLLPRPDAGCGKPEMP